MRRLREFLLDIFFPSFCFGCRRYEPTLLCADCRTGIPLHATMFCAVCRARLPDNKKICHRDAPYRLAAASDYQTPAVQTMILDLKYRGVTTAMSPLATMLRGYLTLLTPCLRQYAVVPIPLSRARLRTRGYNQAELIARVAADALALEMISAALIRRADCLPQSRMPSRQARQENIQGVFAVARPELVAKKNILLIDDVSTSGATLTEAARTLKLSGARKIVGLVIAKA